MPLTRAISVASALSLTGDSASRTSNILFPADEALEKMLTIQPAIRTGIASMLMYRMKAAISPGVRRSAATSRPPTHSIIPVAMEKKKVIIDPRVANSAATL